MSKPALCKDLFVGGLTGVIAALIGNLVFSAVATAAVLIRDSMVRGWSSFGLDGLGPIAEGYLGVALICFGFSAIPALVGGIALAGSIRYLGTKTRHSALVGPISGVILGTGAAGIGILIGLRVAFWDWVEDPAFYIPFILFACVVGAVAGGLAGRKLSKQRHRN